MIRGRRIHCVFLLGVMLAGAVSVVQCEKNRARGKTDREALPDSGERRKLHSAAKRGDLTAVADLLKKGVKVDARDSKGWTALHLAAYWEKHKVAVALVDAGASVDALDATGSTPLHKAATGPGSHIPLVELLLAKGADPYATNRYGTTPVDVTGRAGGSLAVRAVLRRHAAKVAGRPDPTPKPNPKDGPWTPAHQKVRAGDHSVIAKLIKAGANLNAHRPGKKGALAGETILHSVAMMNDKEGALMLLGAGADPNAADDSGWTPLHQMIYFVGNSPHFSFSKEVTGVLLAKGADVDRKNADGQTPLHFAAITTQKDVIRFLLTKGADINARDHAGRSVLLLTMRYRPGTQLGALKDTLKLLLAKGADAGAAARQGLTALHVAGTIGDKGIAAMLIAKGANVNARFVDGWTPLDAAVKHWNPEVAELLRERGAKPGK